MNKKKIIAPLSLFCLSAVMISAVGCSAPAVKDAATDNFKEWIAENQKHEGAMIASAGENNGIRLTSATFTLTSGNEQNFAPGQNYDYSEESSYNSVRITAKAEEGSSVPLTGVTWKVSFTDKSKGGNASDYVSLSSVSANGLSVQVKIKQAFASEITVTAVSSDNPNVTGSITLQYVKRLNAMSLTLPVVSLTSEKEYSLSVNGTIGSGTLTPTVTYARYVKFSSTFSGASGTYYPIEKTMTGTAWKAFLIEHAKDETALETMLASADGNDGYVGIYCTATVTYNGKTYQFITSEAFYPKFTNNAILTASVTTGDKTTVITPPDSSLEGSDNTGTEGGSGESQETVVEYIETETESITIDMEGGDGDYTVTVDEKLQDKITVEVTDGTITVTNTTDEPVAGTVSVGSGNQTVDIPVAFITELTTSVSEIVLENVNGSTSEIICSGGTGVYTVEISDSLKGSVTVTKNGNTITLAYHYSSNVSGTIKIISGSQTITINVSLTNPVVDCLTGDTLITMADGTTKRIDEITYGDKVLAINPKTGEYVATGITYTDSAEHKTYNHYDRFEFDDGTVITTVHRHRFYNCEDEKMIHMDAFSLGDRAYKIDGTMPKLVFAKEHYEEKKTKHYTIFTEMQNYFANGLLSGNRFTKPIKISEIKGGKVNG